MLDSILAFWQRFLQSSLLRLFRTCHLPEAETSTGKFAHDEHRNALERILLDDQKRSDNETDKGSAEKKKANTLPEESDSDVAGGGHKSVVHESVLKLVILFSTFSGEIGMSGFSFGGQLRGCCLGVSLHLCNGHSLIVSSKRLRGTLRIIRKLIHRGAAPMAVKHVGLHELHQEANDGVHNQAFFEIEAQVHRDEIFRPIGSIWPDDRAVDVHAERQDDLVDDEHDGERPLAPEFNHFKPLATPASF
jgi:hypothetical protein